MAQVSSVVVYDGLPISSGGAHSINRLSPEQALHAWRRFLAGCARLDEVEAVIRVDDDGPGPSATNAVLHRLEQAFPTRSQSFGRLHDVPQRRVDEAVALMAEISPQPADEWGNAAVTLFIRAEFLLRRPGEDQLWPGQGRENFGSFVTPTGVKLGVSSARLIMNTTRSMGLILCVPDATEEDVTLMRPGLQEHLPFRLSGKHWTRWTLNKNGKSYRPKRLPIV